MAGRADESTTSLGLDFIKLLSIQKLRTFNFDVTRRRLEVYRLPDGITDAEKARIITDTLQIPTTPSLVSDDRGWLTRKGLLEEKKPVSRKQKLVNPKEEEELMEEIEKIKEHGLTDSDLSDIIRFYLQGVPIAKISSQLGGYAKKRIEILQEADVIPPRVDIRFIRAASNLGGDVATIAQNTEYPPHMIKLILSVPEDKHALDKIPPEGTIFET